MEINGGTVVISLDIYYYDNIKVMHWDAEIIAVVLTCVMVYQSNQVASNVAAEAKSYMKALVAFITQKTILTGYRSPVSF